MHEPELVQITIAVRGHHLTARMEKPEEQVAPEKLLPLLNQFVDGEIQFTCAEEASSGRRISCSKGCSACCRAQPVPITPPEVAHLLRVVSEMPEERRAVLLRRFESHVEQLRSAGLVEEYFRPRHELNAQSALAIARRYIQLGLVCPFLEDDSCSIYADRPFVCRQYLVRSDPELCSRPLDTAIDVLPLQLKPATALLSALGSLTGKPQATIPLALLFEYLRRNSSELTREVNAEALVRSWIQFLP